MGETVFHSRRHRSRAAKTYISNPNITSSKRIRRMSSGAAVPFWRAAGMTYISYSNICANLLRNCLKEPFKSEALAREKVHFSVAKWVDGKPQKPTVRSDAPET